MPGLGGMRLPQTAQVAALMSLTDPHAGQIPSHFSGRTTPLHFPQLTHAYPHDMGGLQRFFQRKAGGSYGKPVGPRAQILLNPTPRP